VSGAGVRPSPPGRRALLILALALVAGGWLRLLDFDDPWSGRPGDFRSVFGGAGTGGPARNFVEWGFRDTLAMPFVWRVELADGTTAIEHYAHHPAAFAVVTALSLELFGVHEWAVRLPWVAVSILTLVACYRLVRLVWGRRTALLAAWLLAVVPMGAHWGSMAWTEGAVALLTCLCLRRYLLWMRGGGTRELAAASLYALVGGLFEWTMAFVLPGLGLHALVTCLRERRGWRWLASAVLLLLGFGLAVALHALHMRLVLSPEEMASDSSSTLAWVTSLRVELARFLELQAGYFARFLTIPAGLCVLAGVALQAGRALRGRLSTEELLFFVLLLPGPLYVAVFPGRSVNHCFFLALSAPGYALAAATALEALRRLPPAAAAVPGFALGGLSAYLAWQVGVPSRIALGEPLTWFAVPLVLARFAAPAALAAWLVAVLARRASGPGGPRRAASDLARGLALASALVAVSGWAAWENVALWTQRRSTRLVELVRTQPLADLLGDRDTVLLQTGTATLPLQFYSRSAVFYGVIERERVEVLRASLLSRLAPGYRVAFLYETTAVARELARGRVSDAARDGFDELLAFLLELDEPVELPGHLLFDLTDWAHGG